MSFDLFLENCTTQAKRVFEEERIQKREKNVLGRSNREEHRVDAKALDADERRGKLRKATGSRKQA